MNRYASDIAALRPARLRAQSTSVLLAGLVLTYITLPLESAVVVFSAAAIGIGLSLSVATVIEATQGVRSLIRVDILMLWVLYGLTFLEFLFPQAAIETFESADWAVDGTLAAMCGFAGIAMGRHLVPWRQRSQFATFSDVRPQHIFRLFVLAAMVGYLHILLAVNFDPLEMLRQMSLPRFAQSWSRGRYGGDLYTLLVEFGALIYLIPPIAGLVYGRWSDFGALQKLVVSIVFLITLYYGVSSGTRNILAVYVITFFGAYVLSQPKVSLWKVGLQGSATLLILALVTFHMLEFRTVGLTNYAFSEHETRDTLFIDQNMVIVSHIVNAFPGQYDYLGFELPFHALIRPIPRAIWPGKPEGLSATIEAVMGATQATVSSTFVGEAYMSAGFLGVFLAGILFGVGAEFWNRIGRGNSSPFAQVLYASGFFCAAISMRSALWIAVTMLPTLALWMYGKLFLSRLPRAQTR